MAPRVTGQFLVVGAVVVVFGIGGNIWLLAQETRHRHRAKQTSRGWNARVLRWIAAVSAVVVLGTIAFARPWYWDVALGLSAVILFAAVETALRSLGSGPSSSLRIAGLTSGAVLAGVALLLLAGIGGVLDGAALSNGDPVPRYHGGAVLEQAVLFQLFWGPIWAEGERPALTQAVRFQDDLAGSNWARAIERSGFGVMSMTSGGCWIDPSPPPTGSEPASSTGSDPFASEVRVALTGGHRLEPCPGTSVPSPPPPVLPGDALVALWLPPQVPYALGGISAHGAVPWAGRPQGLAAAGLPGGYAYWGSAGCASHRSCASLLAQGAAPTYALSHEVIETVTNPFRQAWFADTPVSWTARYVLAHGPSSVWRGIPAYQGELADVCVPGQPDANDRQQVARLSPSGLPVTPFYRPGRGCIAPG